jgi:phosphomannomutase
VSDQRLDTIFKAYDIRGVYPDELDDDVARRVGNAFVAFTGTERVLVGRDMRPSSEPLTAAFADGATLAGADVIDLGLISTDLVYFASVVSTHRRRCSRPATTPPGTTASSCAAPARPVGGHWPDRDPGDDRERALERRRSGPGRAARPLPEYVEHVRSFVDVGALRPLRVVADTANGMGGAVVPPVFAGLPFHLSVLYPELDGTFPNHPANPIQPENLKDLQRSVLDANADVGLAFDGDADRVFLVDDQAQPFRLDHHRHPGKRGSKAPGETVVHHLLESRAGGHGEMGRTPVHAWSAIPSQAVMAETRACRRDTGALLPGTASATPASSPR